MLARSGDRSGCAAQHERQGAEDTTARKMVLGGVFHGREPDLLSETCSLPRFGRVRFRERFRHAER